MSFTSEELRELLINRFMRVQPSQIINDSINDSNIDLDLPMDTHTPTNTTQDIDIIPHYKYLSEPSFALNISSDISPSDEYTIIPCVYIMNMDLQIPFLQYMFMYDTDSEYNFINFTLDNTNINTIRENESKIQIVEENDTKITMNDEIHHEIIHQCSKNLQENNIIDTELDNNQYRGYIKQDDNKLYIFIDCTNIKMNKVNNINFALMDEIINKKNILGYNINPEIIKLFEDNEILTIITDINNTPTILPLVAYICKINQHDMYQNIYTTDGENDIYLNEIIGFDDNDEAIFTFSLEPINKVYNNINRYALLKTEDNYKVIEQSNINNVDIYSVNSTDMFVKIR
jgi:hypothetical protein